MANSENAKVVIGRARFSYLHLFEKWVMEGESEENARFTATLLIPKSDTAQVEKIKKAIDAAYAAAVNEQWGGVEPKKWFNPLQDGDSPKTDGEDRGEAYAGHWFVTAKSTSQPGIVVGKNREECVDKTQVVSGDYGYAAVRFSGYNHKGNKGISCFLNNIWMSRKGEPLGGTTSSPADDFGSINAEEEDDDLL